jgi:DNA-binding GntR family transcriptional regulator
MSEDRGNVRGVFPRRQLSEEVASYVRELIMSGNLRPGDFIRQEPIAEEFGLSATPVREGLLSLRGEGFVELLPRRGFVVASLSASDIRDLFTAQALLAGELVSRAAVRMGPDDLRELTEVHEALRKAAGAGAGELVESLNHDFHRRINLAAEAPRLAWMLSYRRNSRRAGSSRRFPGGPRLPLKTMPPSSPPSAPGTPTRPAPR